MPSFSFLILTYNSTRHIHPFLSTLFEKIGSDIKKGKFELIIVDNNSPDETVATIRATLKELNVEFAEGTPESIKEKTENVRVIKGRENAGYARGINLAASYARGEYLVVINPDAELLESDFDKVKEDFDRNAKMAIAGLCMREYSGHYEKNAGKFFNPLTIFLYTLGLEDVFSLRFAPPRKMKVDFVSGGFVVFRRSIFEELNGFDTDYFMYIEDMDICYRAKKKKYQVFYLPYATIKHWGQGSTNREFAIVNIYKGLCTFYRKHGNTFSYLYVRSLLKLKAFLIALIASGVSDEQLKQTYKKAGQGI